MTEKCSCKEARPKTKVAFCLLPFPAVMKQGGKVVLRNLRAEQKKETGGCHIG
jgi:hypothetical protein